MQNFFGCYLKGAQNNWKETPLVRVSLLNPAGTDIVNKPAENFPLPQTNYQYLYLDAANLSLNENLPSKFR